MHGEYWLYASRMVQINRKEKEEIRIVKIVCLIHINRAGIVRIEACEDTTIKDSIKSEFRYGAGSWCVSIPVIHPCVAQCLEQTVLRYSYVGGSIPLAGALLCLMVQQNSIRDYESHDLGWSHRRGFPFFLPIAQWNRASGFYPVCRRFESF